MKIISLIFLIVLSGPVWAETLNWQTSTFQNGGSVAPRPGALAFFAGGSMPFPNVYAPANYQMMGPPAILPARYYINGVFNPNPLPSVNEPWLYDPRRGPPALAYYYPVPVDPPADTRPAVAAVIAFVTNLFGSSGAACVRCSIHTDNVTRIDEPTVQPPPIAPPPHETEAGLSHIPQVTPPAPSVGDRIASSETDATPARREVARPRPAAAVSVARPPKPRPGIGPRVREKLSPRRVARRRAFTREEERAQNAPIWKSFINNFNSCAPGCEPTGYAAYGERGNLSCHPSGRALDMHGMTCGAQVIRAIDYGPAFQKMLTCMRTKMKVLSHNKPWNGGANITEGHYDHAHFSDGCVVHGRKVW